MTSPVFLFVVPHAALPLQAVGVIEHLWPAFQQHEAFGMGVGRACVLQFPWLARAERAMAVLKVLFPDSQANPIAAVQRFGGEKPTPPAVASCIWWTGSTNIVGFLRDAAPHLGAAQVLLGEGLKAALDQDRKSLRAADLVLAPPPAVVRPKVREVAWSLEPTRQQLARFECDVLQGLPLVFDGLQLEVSAAGHVAKLRGVARVDKAAQARTLVDGLRRLVLWAPYGQSLHPVRGPGLRLSPGAHQAPPFLDLDIQWPASDLTAGAGLRERSVHQILTVLAQLPFWDTIRHAPG